MRPLRSFNSYMSYSRPFERLLGAAKCWVGDFFRGLRPAETRDNPLAKAPGTSYHTRILLIKLIVYSSSGLRSRFQAGASPFTAVRARAGRQSNVAQRSAAAGLCQPAAMKPNRIVFVTTPPRCVPLRIAAAWGANAGACACPLARGATWTRPPGAGPSASADKPEDRKGGRCAV